MDTIHQSDPLSLTLHPIGGLEDIAANYPAPGGLALVTTSSRQSPQFRETTLYHHQHWPTHLQPCPLCSPRIQWWHRDPPRTRKTSLILTTPCWRSGYCLATSSPMTATARPHRTHLPLIPQDVPQKHPQAIASHTLHPQMLYQAQSTPSNSPKSPSTSIGTRSNTKPMTGLGTPARTVTSSTLVQWPPGKS